MASEFKFRSLWYPANIEVTRNVKESAKASHDKWIVRRSRIDLCKYLSIPQTSGPLYFTDKVYFRKNGLYQFTRVKPL